MEKVSIRSASNARISTVQDETGFHITYLQDIQDDYLECTIAPSFSFHEDDYIFFPACCYHGNRFDVNPKSYPPLYSKDEAECVSSITITDVPRLSKDGSGCIEVTTGDLATPCIGVFSRATHQAFFVFTIQQIGGINLGLAYHCGEIIITYPHMRKDKAYRWPHMRPSSDQRYSFKQGDHFSIPIKIVSCPCMSMEDFFQQFFINRHCIGLNHERYIPNSFKEQFLIQKRKYNRDNWLSVPQCYGCGDGNATEAGKEAWQPGWVGGAISSYPLMMLGDGQDWERGEATLQFLFKTQYPSGFFADACDSTGKIIPCVFGKPYARDWHLIRKSADVLFFLFKHIDLYRTRGFAVPDFVVDGTRLLADAFVNLWDRYHEFGQFVYAPNGTMIVSGSTAGAIAPAGLVKAWRFFGNEKYLAVAEESAKMYYMRDALQGYTCGGPEEILQCPDSESAFALLESMVCLYEETKDEAWLKKAVFLTHFCSSWVVSYNYRFPEGCEFSDLGMKTTGAVFANIQNKHAAPGICTLSGDSLYKMYQWTGNPAYLELFLDVTMTISQYMSTKDRPIHSWDVPKDASLLNDDSIRAPREILPEGFICERVNMSDWESERCIGGVFNGSCWPEVSNLLALAECTDFPEVKSFVCRKNVKKW